MCPFPHLTKREREVLDLAARWLGNDAIAQRLMLSTNTIGNRLSDILAKLQADSRAQAVAIARDAGPGHRSVNGDIPSPGCAFGGGMSDRWRSLQPSRPSPAASAGWTHRRRCLG
ncbi:helix-turn-helix transcriptional regulator [Actinomycetes bacterium KLBMP 9797]